MKKQVALYGDVKLKREFCRSCKRWAFVLDTRIQCCNRLVTLEEENKNPRKLKRMCPGSGIRKRPPRSIQREILFLQGKRCLYCSNIFGFPVFWKGKITKTKLCWDHAVPFKFTQGNSKANWIASCQICNGIKSDLVFETIEEARIYVIRERNKKLPSEDRIPETKLSVVQ